MPSISQLSKRQIKTQLKEILQKGVEGGFLSKHGNAYSVDPDGLQAIKPMDIPDEDQDFDEEAEDRRRSASRRRRARARRRSRSRSRRRRR